MVEVRQGLGACRPREAGDQDKYGPTRKCSAPHCKQTTRENKEFCTIHVEQQPYVKYLLNLLAAKEQEDLEVRRKGSSAVNIEGLTVQEMLLHLRQHRRRSIDRLAKELQIDKDIVRAYCIALRKKEYIEISASDRNSHTVILLEKGLNAGIEVPDDEEE